MDFCQALLVQRPPEILRPIVVKRSAKSWYQLIIGLIVVADTSLAQATIKDVVAVAATLHPSRGAVDNFLGRGSAGLNVFGQYRVVVAGVHSTRCHCRLIRAVVAKEIVQRHIAAVLGCR